MRGFRVLIPRRDRNRFRRLAAAIPTKSDSFARWMAILTVAAIGVYLFHVAYIEIEARQGRWARDCPIVGAFRALW